MKDENRPSSPIDLAHEGDFALGGLQISPSTREISRDGIRESLEPKAMQVLVALARAQGKVVSRDELIASCWEGRIVGEDAINRVIGRLRRLSEADNGGSFTIETIPRVGFRLLAKESAAMAEVAPALAMAAKSLPADALAAEPAPAPPTVQSGKRTLMPLLVAALAIAVVAGAALIFWLHASPKTFQAASASPRVAVRLFQTLGQDPQLQQFAGGLQAEIAGELSDNQIPVVAIHAGTATAEAAYVFDGTVERRGANLLVRAHLDDARQAVTVWSSDFSGDAGAPDVLQKQISALASLVGKSALDFDATAKGDSDAMGLYIKFHLYALPLEAKWDDLRILAGKFPRSASLQSDFALDSAVMAVNAAPARAAELRSVAKTGAQRALALNPHDADAFFAQVLSFPSIGHWSERENILLEGLKAAPRDELLTNIESNFLREVGRNSDAVAYGRQAQAQLPRSANRDATLLLAFAATGNSFEGDKLAEETAKFWPTHPWVWNARLQMAVLSTRWDEALALLEPGANLPVPDAVVRAWRGAVIAAKSSDASARRAAAHELAGLLTPNSTQATPPPNEQMSPGDAIGMVAMLGDNDGAFALAAKYLKRDTYADSSFLFWPSLKDFRRDPRFMNLAAGIGLTDYWLASGKWPDFCGEANPPYDCQKEARAAKAAP